ncbi:MAG TPA: SDR family NAD(P)-dependent oxidoreductase [Thermoanaerobaculia bacterium]|nr:SDR family NAD(P)-dependent oxidoreductase [Thermoanaerobaculia bacterium]
MSAEVRSPRAPDWRELPVLVTGGAGFIGSHLVDELVRLGARVRVLDDLSTGSRENLSHLGRSIELVEGDIRDPETCRSAAEGARFVFHQAALGSVPRSMADPATTVAVNVTGTTNVFAAARDAGVARVVYASSSSVYGDSDRLPKREGEEGRPLSPYALSKAMDEELARLFALCFGQQLLGLRYFNVYGPRQSPEGPYAAVVPRFFAACRAGEPPRIHGDGEQSRDFTYVADAVRANLLAAAAPAAACGHAYNVAGGRRTSVLELAEAIRELAGPCPPPLHEPARPGDVRHSQADPTAAREALGFTAEVDLAEGLRRTWEHASLSPRRAPRRGAAWSGEGRGEGGAR